MKSLYTRQFTMMAAVILTSFLLLGGTFAGVSYRYTISAKQDSLAQNAENIASLTGEMLTQGMGFRNEYFRLYVSSAARAANAYVILAENDGEIIYCAGSNGSLVDLTGLYLSKDTLSSFRARGAFDGMSTLGGLFMEKRYLSMRPIMINLAQFSSGSMVVSPTQTGIVLVAASTDSLTEMWRALSTIFLFLAVVVIFIAFLTSSVTSSHQVRPLKEMAEAAKKFGHGEFQVRVDVGNRQDEIAELAVAFNNMADSLAQAEAERSEFIANISHELKTPMTTIAGFADGILDGTIPPEKQKEALQTVSSETRRLSRLVRRMLDLSRLQAAENITTQERFDITEVLLRVLVSLEGKINQKDLDVETSLPEEPVQVWGDPDSITQVCYNLLDNAIKFSAPGTQLGLEIAVKGGKAWVSVRNTGETIPPEELKLIFDRFHKTDRSRSVDRDGVGLGLYIVKTILDNHKENITVTSSEGVTEFTFTLTQA